MDNQQSSYINLDLLKFESVEDSTTIPQGSTFRSVRSIRKKTVYLKDKFVIYKISNIINNKIYIGSAAQFDKRIGTHVSRLRKNIHDNKHLQNAWNKYGESNFKFEIIEKSNYENLLIREQYWLDTTQCYFPDIGYNINECAESRRGGTMPESAKIKIGNFWRGKKFTEERVIDLRNRAAINQGKAIIALRLSDNKKKEFSSMSEASRELKVSIAAISRQCGYNLNPNNITKRRKDSFYHFRYKDIV